MVTTRNQAKLRPESPPRSISQLPRRKAIKKDAQDDQDADEGQALNPQSLNDVLPQLDPSGQARPPAAAAAPQAAASSLPSRPLRPEDKLLKPLPKEPMECTKLPDGPEPTVIEVEYPAREDLRPIEGSADAAVQEALQGASSAEWVEVLAALGMLRRLVAHHAEACSPALPAAVPLIVKSVRSLRSTVSKTAIMTATDLFISFGAAVLPYTDIGGAAKPLDSLLAQLLMKAASNDKRFVLEEAERALQILADVMRPAQLLPLLAPYSEHKNPKVRGKSARIMAASAIRMTPSEAADYGLAPLIQTAARLITDNTPDARDAAKQLALHVKNALSDAEVEERMAISVQAPPEPEEGQEAAPPLTKWEYYCQTTLGVAKAAPLLRAAQ